MGYWEALRRRISEITGRPVAEDDDAIFKYYRGIAPSSGAVLFPGHVFTPATTPPGYEYYTDTNGKVAVKCKHNTSGALTVTEASAAGAATTAQYIYCHTIQAIPANIAGVTLDQVTAASRARRIGRAVITVAAGAFANEILQTVAGAYYGVIRILLIQSNANEAAGAASITFESPAGTNALPALCVLPALTANVFSNCLEGLIVTHASLTDTQNIVLDGAGFTGTQFIITYEYWLET